MKIVFDTYAWIEYFSGSDQGLVVKEHLEKAEIITPLIVLLELSYKADKEGWDMKKFLNFIKLKSEIVGINENFVLKFGRIYNDTRKKIKDFGIADAIILTSALEENAKVLTGDSHFEKFDRTIFLK
jgi:predicted nucleic acid-binding protein